MFALRRSCCVHLRGARRWLCTATSSDYALLQEANSASIQAEALCSSATRDDSQDPQLPFVARAGVFAQQRAGDSGGRVALQATNGARVTYQELLERSALVASELLALCGRPSLDGARVAMLCQPGPTYVLLQWGIWRAGGITVPLCPSHPLPELEYVVEDAQAELLAVDSSHSDTGSELVLGRSEESQLVGAWVCPDDFDDDARAAPKDGSLPFVRMDDPASIMYTSGTTGRPKGVLQTHRSTQAQVTDLIEAWAWQPSDHILHFLPLHHVHGVVNKLACALWAGALCEFVAWDAKAVWSRIAAQNGLTLFMAVPTVYVQLIRAYDAATAEERQQYVEGAKALRLMVSGSAPLPVPVLQRWREITSHVLLERYGMTEFGMALSNALEVDARKPGCVGLPLRSLEVRIVDDDGHVVEPPEETAGELRVRGANVFQGYWRKPEATEEAFDEEGYFRTGDVAAWSVKAGCYAILGRASVDIIKTSGHKVSALDVERTLLGHEDVEEAAVVGVPHPTRGEAIVAVVTVRGGAAGDAETLKRFCAENGAPEKRPLEVIVVEAIAKNAMGKVNKKALPESVAELKEVEARFQRE